MNDGKTGGRPLAAMLSTKMRVDGTKAAEMAGIIGISASYLSQLLTGDKAFSGVDNAVLRAVARYLELPAVVCFVLAGKLQHEDFLEYEVVFEAELHRALTVVAASPYGLEAAVDSVMLAGVPEPVKLLLVLMYQAASGAEVVTGKRRWPWTAPRQSALLDILVR